MNQSSCSSICSRRQFLSGLAACAGCTAGAALLGMQPARAGSPSAGKPKIRVVFCETANDKPIWPNIGYDFEARRKKLLTTLQQGCPKLELLPTCVNDVAKDA